MNEAKKITTIYLAPLGLRGNCESTTQGDAPDGRLPLGWLILPRWGRTAFVAHQHCLKEFPHANDLLIPGYRLRDINLFLG